MTITQKQAQTQRQTLSPALQQSITILQKDVVDLTAYLNELSLENPLFEVHSRLGQVAASGAATRPIADSHQQSLDDYLLEQVSLTMRPTPLRQVVTALICQLQPSGLLALTPEDVAAALGVSLVTAQDAIVLLQQLDPPGVGAANLQECLLLQARADANAPAIVEAILADHYQALLHQDWPALKSALTISEADLQEALAYIEQLTTNPGAQYDVGEHQYIIPDLVVHLHDGKLSLHLIRHGQPKLVFAEATYATLKQTNDATVTAYLAAKRREFLALEKSLQRRQETLLTVGQLIVAGQAAYLSGETTTLQPLLARDIANRMQVNTSTISRTLANKYIQTDQGILPLSFFLTRRSTRTPDGTALSSTQIEAHLKALIASEPATQPYSDATLATRLQQAGYPIARRTVAKYRQLNHIPAARMRKQQG